MLEVETFKRPTTSEILTSTWINKNFRNNGLTIKTGRTQTGLTESFGSP